MKKLSTRTLLAFFVSLQLLGQGITIKPNRIETDYSNAENIFLRNTETPNIIGVRINGSHVNPSATNDNQHLLSLEGRGYGGGNFSTLRAGIRLTSSQNWNANNQGARMEMFTTPQNSTVFKSRMIINHDGKVGIGEYFHSLNFVPDHQLEVQQPTNSDRGVGVYRYGGDAPTYFGISARGTYLLPNATQLGDILARYAGKGYDGTAFTSSRARIEMIANQNWTSTVNGTDIRFYTTQGGGTSTTEKMVIRGNGNVGINDPNPQSRLSVNGDLQLGVENKNVPDNNTTFNNLDRNGKSVIRFSGDGVAHIKGIMGGVDGMVLHLYSADGTVLKLYLHDGDADMGNKILFDTGGGWIIEGKLRVRPLSGCTLVYDGTSQFWHVLGNN